MFHGIKRKIFFWRTYSHVVGTMGRMAKRLAIIQRERQAELNILRAREARAQIELGNAATARENLTKLFPGL
jgi:Trk-type K+ transport system membrane component